MQCQISVFNLTAHICHHICVSDKLVHTVYEIQLAEKLNNRDLTFEIQPLQSFVIFISSCKVITF